MSLEQTSAGKVYLSGCCRSLQVSQLFEVTYASKAVKMLNFQVSCLKWNNLLF